MAYVDGYVLPVKKNKIDAYRQMAALAGAVWREHGALEYREWIAEDVKSGEHTSFPQAVKLQDDEIVVFSWIVFESRDHRDKVNALAMSDSRLASMMQPAETAFDGKRMFWGGFEPLVAV